MRTYSQAEIIKTLKEKQISFFSLADFESLFPIRKRPSLYKRIQRLEKQGLINRLIKGKYLFPFNPANDFTIANYLYQPSYISLETALSFYGIITGFSYKITSITPKKSKQIIVKEKEYCYSQIKPNLFWGYEKKEDFLIAEPEKAFLDYLYLTKKGWRKIDWSELNLTEINKKKLFFYGKKFKDNNLLKILYQKI